MRLFRSPLLLRLVATVLVAGVASTLAPSAVARDARSVSLRVLLDDADAFETALDAAWNAAPGEDAVAVFASVYAEAVGDGLTAEAVYDLLDGQALGLVAPPAPDDAAFSAPPALAGPGAVHAVLPASGASVSLPAADLAVPEAAVLPSRPEAAAHQPRAP